jgi:hypothetical protein
MNRTVPEADPQAYARMKYELENRSGPGMMGHVWGIFRKSPDVSLAAKSGSPAMTPLQPQVPASVPSTAAGTTGVNADVSVSTVTDSTALDTQPDARQNPPAAGTGGGAAPPSDQNTAAPADAGTAQPLPTNRQVPQGKGKKNKKSKNAVNAPAAGATSAPAAATDPAANSAPAANPAPSGAAAPADAPQK